MLFFFFNSVIQILEQILIRTNGLQNIVEEFITWNESWRLASWYISGMGHTLL